VKPPRVNLAALPTPLIRARRLEVALDAGPLFIKRDDLTGFGVAGNKARPLEFLIGEAMEKGCDVFVAVGGPSSNFCAAAAMAACAVGIDCDLLFPGAPPSSPSATIELARAAGARLIFGAAATRDGLDDAVRGHAHDLRVRGRSPYAVPRGGATPVGGLGSFYAAQELAEQCDRDGIAARTVVVPTGSGGTQAGLVAGQVGLGLPWRVIGASVSRPAEGLAESILGTARACAAAVGHDQPTPDDIDVRDVRGSGFGVASAEDRASAALAFRHEGLLLDRYYGAKAMTLFRSLLANGTPTPAVFWHGGGVTAAVTALLQGAV
jgi:1-aminocyclopropane-1-carboxylate deaminase/D-cysteine desulfhydrase-like pyridoxal-dependent ACC family enzyme